MAGRNPLNKILFTTVFLLSFLSVFSQKQGNIWYFGQYAGVSFNNYNPKPLYNSAMFQYEGCATISDTNGNLLFYTNGMTVWNRKHQEMNNGTGLKGGYPSTQSSIIVPKPFDNNIYYVFTIDDVAGPDGLEFSIIDMSKDNGYGKVITKNVPLLTPTTEKITAVTHANDSSIWVITHGWDTNAFFSYLVTDSGLVTTPVVSNAGMVHGGSYSKASGYLKASPDGSKIATAIQTYYGKVDILDFNDSTGIVSNPINITSIIDPYGLEFSPDGSKLFVSSQSQGDIYEFNLAAGTVSDIKSSKILIGASVSQVGALQIAIDGRIYVARTAGYLGVIKNPNEYGSNTAYIDNGLYLGGKQSKYGLPTFNQSYFYNPEFAYENFCFGDSTKFYIFNTGFVDSVRWYFGDFASGSKNTSSDFRPAHVYTSPGTFMVGLFIHHQGSIDTITWNIPIHPKPSPGFSTNDSTQCLDGNYFVFLNSSSIPTGSMTYEWHFGDGDSSTQYSPVHSFSQQNTFSTQLIAISDHGCRDTIYHSIITYPEPVAGFVMNDSAQCFDRNRYEFTNTSSIAYGNMFYHWSFGDGDTSNLLNPKHTYSVADTFHVQLITTSSKHCKDTVEQSAYVHVHQTPLASFHVDDTSKCFLGNKFNFTNTSYLNSGTMHFEWFFDDGDSLSKKNPSHLYDTSGRFNVELIAISDWNCKDKAYQEIYVNPEPQAGFTLNDSAQCLSGNKAVFNNTSSIEFTIIDNLWDFGDNQFSTQTNPSHIYVTDDSFRVKLLVTSEFGCEDSAFKIINIRSMPLVSFGVNDLSQCLSANRFEFFNLSTINRGSIQAYQWDMDDGNTYSSKNPVHVYSNYGNFKVKLLATSDNGCKDSTTNTVTVNPMPEAVLNIKNPAQCLQDNFFEFTNNSTIPTGLVSNHIFYTGDGFSSSTARLNYTYKSEGIYLVSYYAISDEGCKDSAFQNVTVHPMPQIDFDINDVAQCLNDNLFVFKNNTAIATGSVPGYTWLFGDGNSDNMNISTSHTYNAYGSYTVELRALSDKNCFDSLVKNIAVHPNPDANFAVDNPAQCLPGNKFSFTNKSTIPQGSINQFYWLFGDSTNSSQNDPVHTFKKDGTFKVQMRITSAKGCTDSLIQNIVVHPRPFADFHAATPCLESSTQFTDKTQINSPDKISKYTWDFGDSSYTNSYNPSHFYLKPGIYSAKLVVQSNNQCTDSIIKKLRVNDHPEPVDLVRATVNKGEFVKLEWTPALNGAVRYYDIERSDNGFAFSNLTAVSPTELAYLDKSSLVNQKSYYYRVRVVDSCAYKSPYSNVGRSILLIVEDNSDPPYLSWTKYEQWANGIESQEVQLQDQGSGFFEVLSTIIADSFNFTDDVNAILMDKYCYRIVAKENLTGVESVSNIVCNTLPLLVWVPNSFSPNQDGINEFFEVKGKYITGLHISIFNRWGEEVFSSDDINFKWDGSFKGKPCQSGSYYYRIAVSGTNNQQFISNGSLLILE